jgi:hypothetical protein
MKPMMGSLDSMGLSQGILWAERDSECPCSLSVTVCGLKVVLVKTTCISQYFSVYHPLLKNSQTRS